MNGRDEQDRPIIEYTYPDWVRDGSRKIMLGHSCDEWIIGTPAEAREFIKQLTAIVEQAEANPDQEILRDEQS